MLVAFPLPFPPSSTVVLATLHDRARCDCAIEPGDRRRNLSRRCLYSATCDPLSHISATARDETNRHDAVVRIRQRRRLQIPWSPTTLRAPSPQRSTQPIPRCRSRRGRALPHALARPLARARRQRLQRCRGRRIPADRSFALTAIPAARTVPPLAGIQPARRWTEGQVGQ